MAPRIPDSFETSGLSSTIPLIDLSPLFLSPDSPELHHAVVTQIAHASEEWGFFQVTNHGLSIDLLELVFGAAKSFFELPLEEKIKARPAPGASPVPTGFVHDDYTRGVLDHKEHFLIFQEGSTSQEIRYRYSQYNVWPEKPQEFRPTVEKLLVELEKTAILLMGLVSESLGLPRDAVHDAFKEKTNALSIFRYPQSEDPACGTSTHKDGNVLTLLVQNEISGLQVLKDDQWVTVEPIEGALVINIGDMLQIWTNGKYKSIPHRVMNNNKGTRYSLGFFCTPGGQTLMAPMQEFTVKIGQPPKYRPFTYQEYLMHRFANKKNMSKDTPDIGIYIYETEAAAKYRSSLIPAYRRDPQKTNTLTT